MATQKERTESIATLEQEFKGAKGIYMTDFNKINVEKITQFRRNLRNCGTKYIVVKNSLARIALERCGLNELTPFIKGPLGVAVTKKDGISPAKVIRDFKKSNKDLLELKVAYVDGVVFNAQQAERLADLPSREVLLSQLLSCLKAPMTGFAGALNGILSKFVGTLESVKVKKEKENA